MKCTRFAFCPLMVKEMGKVGPHCPGGRELALNRLQRRTRERGDGDFTGAGENRLGGLRRNTSITIIEGKGKSHTHGFR